MRQKFSYVMKMKNYRTVPIRANPHVISPIVLPVQRYNVPKVVFAVQAIHVKTAMPIVHVFNVQLH